MKFLSCNLIPRQRCKQPAIIIILVLQYIAFFFIHLFEDDC